MNSGRFKKHRREFVRQTLGVIALFSVFKLMPASADSEKALVKSVKSDFINNYYNVIINDEAYRRKLLADPKTVLCDEYGYLASENFDIRIVDEREDTIVILLPCRPQDGIISKARATEVAQQSYDLLFSSGIGGFFIPEDGLKWILRDMRTAWINKNSA